MTDTLRHVCKCGHDRGPHLKETDDDEVEYLSCLAIFCECLYYKEVKFGSEETGDT